MSSTIVKTSFDFVVDHIDDTDAADLGIGIGAGADDDVDDDNIAVGDNTEVDCVECSMMNVELRDVVG